MAETGRCCCGGCLLLVIIAALKNAEVKGMSAQLNTGNIGLIENLGKALFTEYVVPFEISSILFLSAMVGTVVLGKKINKAFMPIERYIFLAIALFCIGIAGVLIRRNAIIVFMCIELMLNAVNLLLVAFSKMHHLNNAANPNSRVSDGQLFVFFIMVVACS